MKILVTDPIIDAGLDRLRGVGYEVETVYDVEGDALLEAVSDVNGLVIRSGTQVTAEVFEVVPDLVIAGRVGTGVDNIDIDVTTQHGIIVANTPEENVCATTEHTVAMGLTTVRSIPQAHAHLRGDEQAKSDYLGNEVSDKILGVVGLGRVGQEAAKKFSSLGMDIVAYDPYIDEERADQLGVELVEFDVCLSHANLPTVHMLLTPETEGLISTDKLETIGSGYLVNYVHGSVVDKAALAGAVDVGIIDEVAVDVPVDGPVSPDNPLLPIDGMVATPHLDMFTPAVQKNVVVSVAGQVVAAFRDELVVNASNAPPADGNTFPHTQPYISLAETAGKTAAQLLDGRLSEAEVAYIGDIVAENIELVTASVLKGVLTPPEWQVSAVNTPQVAKEHGIEIVESKSRQSDDSQSLVIVTIRNGDKEMIVSGTLFTSEGPRIVRINGCRPDATPRGQMLITRNYDKPGVIGFIGIALGENDVNIVGMFNARRMKAGGEALTAYNLDGDVSESAHEKLLVDARITDVDLIAL